MKGVTLFVFPKVHTFQHCLFVLCPSVSHATIHGARVVSTIWLLIGTNSDLFTIEEPLERDIDDNLSQTPGTLNAVPKQG